jgi:cytochrome c553
MRLVATLLLGIGLLALAAVGAHEAARTVATTDGPLRATAADTCAICHGTSAATPPR